MNYALRSALGIIPKKVGREQPELQNFVTSRVSELVTLKMTGTGMKLRNGKCRVCFGLTAETEAKVLRFCRERGLTFDEAVNILLQKVCQPRVVGQVLRDGHTGHSESAAKKSRAKSLRASDGR